MSTDDGFVQHASVGAAERPVIRAERFQPVVCDGVKLMSMGLLMSADNPVFPTAYSEIVNFNGREPQPDITETGFSIVGPEVLAKAGLTTSDIRMFHPYDDFLIAEVLQLEQFGWCGRGEGSDFLLETDVSFRGILPINTGGGQISAGQIGLASGMTNLVEAVRQMTGEAGARQVSDPRNALVTGIGIIPYGRNWFVSNALTIEQ